MVSPEFAVELPKDFTAKLSQNKDHLEINITNMRLRTYIGINDWEQKNKQDVVINIKITCDNQVYDACATDNIDDTLNYKKISKMIIDYVEQYRFYLLEKMTAGILKIILEQPKVLSAEVRCDKPGALRFSESVGISIKGTNS